MIHSPFQHIACVEQRISCDTPTVFCPICGTCIVNNSNEEVNTCNHLEFIFLKDTNEFVYQSRNCKNKFGNINMSSIDKSDFGAVLKLAGYNRQLFAIQITYGPELCAFSNVYAFSYE